MPTKTLDVKVAMDQVGGDLTELARLAGFVLEDCGSWEIQAVAVSCRRVAIPTQRADVS